MEDMADTRAWRQGIRARLASARAALLEQYIGLDEQTLTTCPVRGTWTACDLLAHVAALDDLYAGNIEAVLDGRIDAVVPPSAVAGSQPRPASSSPHDLPLNSVLDAFQAARVRFLDALARAADEQIFCPINLPWGDDSIRTWTEECCRHDADHTRDLNTWASPHTVDFVPGPTPVLIAALRAARKELLTQIALIPPSDREMSPTVPGEILRLAFSRQLTREQGLCLRLASQAQSCSQRDAGNDEIPWQQLWTSLHRTRQQLLTAIGNRDLDADTYQELAALIKSDRTCAAALGSRTSPPTCSPS